MRFDEVCLMLTSDVKMHISPGEQCTHINTKSTVDVTKARASSAGAVASLLLHCCCTAPFVVLWCIPWLRGCFSNSEGVRFYIVLLCSVLAPL